MSYPGMLRKLRFTGILFPMPAWSVRREAWSVISLLGITGRYSLIRAVVSPDPPVLCERRSTPVPDRWRVTWRVRPAERRSFVEHYLGESSGSAVDAARRGVYSTPHPAGGQHATISYVSPHSLSPNR